MLHIPSSLNTTKLTKNPKSDYLSRASIQAIEDELLHNPSQVIQDHSRANRTTNCLRQWLHAPHQNPTMSTDLTGKWTQRFYLLPYPTIFAAKPNKENPHRRIEIGLFHLPGGANSNSNLELELRGLRLGLRWKRRRCERFRQLSTELRLWGFQKGKREEKGGSTSDATQQVTTGSFNHRLSGRHEARGFDKLTRVVVWARYRWRDVIGWWLEP